MGSSKNRYPMKNCYTRLSLVLTLLCIASMGWISKASAQLVTLGTGTSTSNLGTSGTGISPFGTYYHNDRTQLLYRAAEFNAAGANYGASGGDILTIGFEVSNANSYAMDGFTIKIKNTSDTSLASYVSGLTTVFTSNGQTVSNGWNDFTLPVPYHWNGTDNIVVQVCFDNSGYGNNSRVKYTTTSFTSVRSSYCDNCSGCEVTNSTNAYTSRANTRFNMVPSVPNDAGVSQLNTPTMPACNLDSNVSVTLKNFGTSALTSAVLNWKVNGVTKTPVNWTGNLAPQASVAVTLGNNPFANNTNHNIVVWTTLPNNVADTSNHNDSLLASARSSYSGTFTMSKTPGSNPDFSSFTEAQTAFENFGICGPIVVNVDDTTYSEQVVFKPLGGISSTNTVTYQSTSGNNANVIFTHSASGSGDNYTARIAGGDYYTFKNMTIQNLGSSYKRAVVLSDSAQYNTFEGCVIQSTTTTSTFSSNRAVVYSSGVGNNYNTFLKNEIKGGTYGMDLNGNTSNHDIGLKLIENRFIDQRTTAIELRGQKGAEITGNYFKADNATTFSYAIEASNSINIKIINNNIDKGNTAYRYGIYLSTSYGAVNNYANITGNRVKFRYYGIYLSSGVFNAISNNTVFADVSASSSSRALYITNGTANKVINNNIVNGEGGYAYYINGSPVSESDNNNFYSSGTNAFYAGSAITDLAAFKAATNLDSNSLEVVNTITDTAKLKTCNDSINGKGKMNPWAVADFEGDVRDANTPDIGADEFASISGFSLGADRVLCAGDTITLNVYSFDTAVWGGTDTNKIKKITTPGSYSVKAWNVCGTAYDTIVVTPQAQSNLANTMNICDGDSITLNTGITNGKYTWSSSDTTAAIKVKIAGTYKVTVVDAYGCTSKDSTVVTKSTAVNLADSVRFCEGNNATLDAVISGTYLWSDNSTGQTLVVTASGSYSVTVTDGHNCVSKDTTVVTKVLNPVASFNIASNNYASVFVNNTSQNGTSYVWDFGDGNTSNSENPVAHPYAYTTANKDYTIKLVVTNECGSDSVSKKITVNSLTSVEGVTADENIEVYPNPASDFITLSIDTRENVSATVRLTNISGQEVVSRVIRNVTGNSKTTLDLSEVSKGIYFVNVTLGDKNYTYKVIKH